MKKTTTLFVSKHLRIELIITLIALLGPNYNASLTATKWMLPSRQTSPRTSSIVFEADGSSNTKPTRVDTARSEIAVDTGCSNKKIKYII